MSSNNIKVVFKESGLPSVSRYAVIEIEDILKIIRPYLNNDEEPVSMDVCYVDAELIFEIRRKDK